jgi:hypothetical protein
MLSLRTCVRRVARLVSIVTALAVFNPAQATYLNSLAWSRYVNTTQSLLKVDPAGNTFMVYCVPNAGGTDVCLIRFDPSGNVTLSKALYHRASSEITLYSVFVSPLLDNKQFIYTSLNENTSTYISGAIITKSDLAGAVVWQRSFTGPVNRFYFTGTSVDNTDTFRVAFGLFNGSNTSLEMFQLGAAGETVFDKSNSKILPQKSDFVNGKWSIVGTDMAPDGGYIGLKWGVYDPSTGSAVTSAKFDDSDNGTYRYSYWSINSYADPAGAIDLCVAVNVYRDSNFADLGTFHFIRRYNTTGSLQWVSQSFPGHVREVASTGSNDSFFVIGQVSYSNFVECFDHYGNRISRSDTLAGPSTPFSTPCDRLGAYFFSVSFPNLRTVNMSRVDASAQLAWSGTQSSPYGAQQDYSSVSDSVEANNNLYCAIVQAKQGSGKNTVVQRYVPGITVSALSVSNSSATGGTIVPLKVSLNAPAPAGGMIVVLKSSSDKLIFPNKTTTYSAAIPSGSIYATVMVHPSPVIANTLVTISGNQNGVQRAVSLTITP